MRAAGRLRSQIALEPQHFNATRSQYKIEHHRTNAAAINSVTPKPDRN